MAVYATKEWLDEVQTRMNEDADLAEAASGMKKSFQYVIEADDKAGFPKTTEVGWMLEDGSVTETWEGTTDTPDFTLIGPYSVFKNINTGEISANNAIATGQLQVDGSVTEVIKHADAIEAMQNVLDRMNQDGATEWPA